MSSIILQADAAQLPFPDKSVDLVLASPPYLDARWYDDRDQHARNLQEWIDWMMVVSREAVRVSRGLVLWVVAGVTRDWCYQPGPEGLLYEWVKQGGIAWRPAYWRRVGIPGSGGKQWLRADVETILAFTGDRGMIPWADNTANGHPPKYAPGGEMAYRLSNGSRRNAFGNTGHPSSASGRKQNGDFKPERKPFGDGGAFPETANGDTRRRKAQTRRKSTGERPGRRIVTNPQDGQHQNEQDYQEPVLANPGNCITNIPVGGGMLGHKLAHENEAPYPVTLAKWFIRSWCPPGGTVLDPFLGSGTTLQAAQELNRNGIGCDIRESQCQLSRRRLASGIQRELV